MERERAVIVEWVHSLCDSGLLKQCKEKLDLLRNVLVDPLQQARRSLRNHDVALQADDSQRSQANGIRWKVRTQEIYQSLACIYN